MGVHFTTVYYTTWLLLLYSCQWPHNFQFQLSKSSNFLVKRTILQGQNALEREKPILYSMQLIPPPLLHEYKILQSEEVIEKKKIWQKSSSFYHSRRGIGNHWRKNNVWSLSLSLLQFCYFWINCYLILIRSHRTNLKDLFEMVTDWLTMKKLYGQKRKKLYIRMNENETKRNEK